MAVYKSEETTKDGRCWYFRVYYKDHTGKRKEKYSKMFKTKSEALEEERLFLMKRDNPTRKNFHLVAKDYLENSKNDKRDSTYFSYERDYRKHIKPYFENKDINDITTQDILNWKKEMDEKELKVSYKNKVYTVFKNILDYAMVYYGLKSNVLTTCGRFKKKSDEIVEDDKKLRYITFKEFSEFISVIDNELYFVFFSFLYYTGCRLGETLALTWNDINFDTREIKINKSLSKKSLDSLYNITATKNNLNRTIKMSNTLYNVMSEYYNKRKQYTNFENTWFVFGDIVPMKHTTIARYKKKYFELSGVKEITLHEFRHSHVSLLINEYIKTSKEKNMKVDTAKFFLMMSERMGHTIEVMQKVYMHLFPSVQDEIVDLLDNL